MSKCSESVVMLMHEYLDGTIDRAGEERLREHLETCEACRLHFKQLERVETLLQNVQSVNAPSDFTQSVMQRLPESPKTVSRPTVVPFRQKLRRHPLLVAVAIFFVLMSATLFSTYEGGSNELAYTNEPGLVVEGDTVIVPKDVVIEGDLVVENGHLIVEGEVQGDVTVVKGTKYMASTAVITGNDEEIDQWFGWLWYKLKTSIATLGNSEENVADQ